MSRRRAAALVTLGLLALTACSEDVATTPDEPHELAPSRPPVDEPLVTVDTYPAVVNPSVVEASGSARTVTTQSTTPQLNVTWPELGHAALDARLATDAAARVDAFTASGGDELNVTWSIVGSSPEVIGVMAEEYEVAGGRTRDTWATVWYDATTGTVVPNAALVDDPAELAGAVTDALEGQASVDPVALEGTLATGAPVLAFTENGELFVGFDEFTLAPANTGRINVVLTQDATDDLLSDLGEAARDSLVSPSDLPPDPSGASDDPSDPGTTDDPDATATTPPAPAEPVDCAAVVCVALALDGGPSSETADVLAALADADARATFFVLGQQVATYPVATAAIAADGQELGVHSWTHRDLTRLPLPELDGEITRTVAAVEDAADVTPTLLLPPYGATGTAVASRAANAGLTVVTATSADVDASPASAAELTAQALAQAAPGAVVTLPGATGATAEALPAIVAGLRERGLTVVTVGELVGAMRG